MTMNTTGHPQEGGPIERFAGSYAFLSSFARSEVVLDGVSYSTLEHAFHAAKTTNPHERQWIAAAPTPAEAKRRGRKVTLADDWDHRRIAVMRELVIDKFTRHPALRAALLATGERELVEGNHWGDRFWGVCDGKGENHLGRLLMAVRAHLAASDTGAGADPEASGSETTDDEVIVGYDVRLYVHVDVARRRITRAVVDPTTAADPTVDAHEGEERTMAAFAVCDDPSAHWPAWEVA